MVSIQNQIREFALKNLHIEIENVKKDYDRDTKDRLAFLTEQAAIARKLDLQKNTMASQRFNTQNIFVANVRTDGPFYLNGYIAIEEEINLIENRKNKTPLNQTYFKAKMVKIATADFETNNKGNLYYALAIVLGGMIGVVYVLIANAFRIRRTLLTNS